MRRVLQKPMPPRRYGRPEMAKAGYQVIFDEEGSGALNQVTMEWIPMSEEEDAWFLDMWVKSEDHTGKPGKGFPRQE